MGKPRRGPFVKRPSPLAEVHSARLSLGVAAPAAARVRDSMFWHRFSGLDYEADDLERGSHGSTSSASTIDLKDKPEDDDWLALQRREERRCKCVCMVVTLWLLLMIIVGAIVGWWFTKGPGKTS